MANGSELVRAAIAVLLMVALGTALVGGGLFSLGNGDAVFEPAPQSFEQVSAGDEISSDIEVTPSTGNALGVFGDADGFAAVPDPNATTRQNGWALAVTVEPLTVDQNNTHLIYAEANGTLVVVYEAGNYAAYYDTPGGDHAYVTAPASGGKQAVGVEFGSGELRLYVDGSLVDTDTADGIDHARAPAYEWDGTVDEFRRWEAPVGNATHAAYANDPIQPLNTSTATHRAMFNDEDRDEVYYASDDLTLTGTTSLVDGVEPPTLTRGTDYELTTSPIEVRVVSGGYLTNAPVVFVFGAAGGGVVGEIVSFLPVLVFLLPLVYIANIVQREVSGV